MKTKHIIITLFLILAISSTAFTVAAKDEIRVISLPIPASYDDAMPIKVLLSRTAQIDIVSAGYLNVYDKKTHAFVTGFMSFPITIMFKNGSLYINDQYMPCDKLHLVSPSEKFTIKGRTYSGAIDIVKSNGQFLVINEVDLETYVKGVLPSEMFAKWPKEALKAQAVVSRTYAVFSAIERKYDDVHVSDTVSSQVYSGMSARTAETDAAVDETRGQILTYEEEIFPAFFHSTCGGHTTFAEFVWRVTPHPCLTSVYCPFCWESKYYTWTTTITLDEMEKKLNEKGIITGDLLAFKKASVDTAGRIIEFEIESDKQIVTANANDIRVLIFPDIMKSTFFTMDASSEHLMFQGRGWGHGVGMCQWGAQRMAADGYDYKVIVRFYYTHSTITLLPHVEHEYFDLIMQ
ncbi:MAG: SpoIID/LytB domain-containing protein [Candidatus Omnitrophica bacterium]|nr:SpoIID/LytB domain-containing protein [Candidatus Omnitrophota bacterium]